MTDIRTIYAGHIAGTLILEMGGREITLGTITVPLKAVEDTLNSRHAVFRLEPDVDALRDRLAELTTTDTEENDNEC